MRSLEEQKRGRCIHFTGTQHKVCEAGVNYDSVTVKGKGIPCLRGATSFVHGESLPCDKRHWPTDAEVEEMVSESHAATERMLAGLAAVAADAKLRGLGKGHGGNGEVACPVCQAGTIRYSVAAYNGHRHARCSTDGCVWFME